MLIEPSDFFSIQILGWEDQDGDLTPGGFPSHCVEHLETVHPRHHQIQDNRCRAT
jgi:hypothetical protein